MPCDYSKYPKNWKWIAKQIVARGRNRCELCHVHNGMFYWRDGEGYPWEEEMDGLRGVKIVLTVHHINYDVTDNRGYNLISLCQRCHNRLDLPYRMENRFLRKAKAQNEEKKGAL